MIQVEIRDADGSVVERRDVEPRCGDYCDTCGECLTCWSHAEARCQRPRLVFYTDMDADRIAELRAQ